MTDQDAIKTLTPLLLSLGWTQPETDDVEPSGVRGANKQPQEQYYDSSRFTENLDALLKHLDQAHEIIINEKFMNQLQQIDDQYDSVKVHQVTKLNEALVTGIVHMEDIYRLDE